MRAALIFALAVAQEAAKSQDYAADSKQYYGKYMSQGGSSSDAGYEKYMNQSEGKFLEKAHSDPAILGLRGNTSALKQKLQEVEHARETLTTYVPKSYQAAPLAQMDKDVKDLRAMLEEAEKAKTAKAESSVTVTVALVEADSAADIEKKMTEVKAEERHIKSYVPAAYQAGALKAADKEMAGLEKAKEGAEAAEENKTVKHENANGLVEMPLAEVEKKEEKKEAPAKKSCWHYFFCGDESELAEKKEEPKKEEAPAKKSCWHYFFCGDESELAEKKEEPKKEEGPAKKSCWHYFFCGDESELAEKKEESKKEEAPAKKTCWHYFFCGDDLEAQQSTSWTSPTVLFLCAVVVGGAQVAINRRRRVTVDPAPLLG
jgi:hypothetical protein